MSSTQRPSAAKPAPQVPDGIRRTEGVAGGDACVRDTRIAVWTLVRLKRLGRTDEQLVEDFPGLTPADLDAAWAYFRQHSGEIDDAIAAEAQED
ncbi:MAG: DUF433 domain-containing protein [Gemmatimonadota bacterium]|nr:DUF433 domain-containing protein [Gemmatimonadota bacterium]